MAITLVKNEQVALDWLKENYPRAIEECTGTNIERVERVCGNLGHDIEWTDEPFRMTLEQYERIDALAQNLGEWEMDQEYAEEDDDYMSELINLAKELSISECELSEIVTDLSFKYSN